MNPMQSPNIGPYSEDKMNLAEIVLRRNELVAQRTQADKDHEKSQKVLTNEIVSLNEQLRIIELQLDAAKIQLAEQVIYVKGAYIPAGDDTEKVQSAINDLADGCSKTGYGHLRTEYFGCKNYDRWYHQGSNHSYGFGPSHGSIVFEIGLKPTMLENLKTREMTTEERDAAIYYLLNLKPIQLAKDNART